MGLAAELTRQKTELFEEIPEQMSMYVRHEGKRTTKNQKKKTKKKTKPEMSKKKSGTLLTSLTYVSLARVSQAALVVKNLPANAGDIRDVGSIPGSGRSSGEGNGNPLQYSCLNRVLDTRIPRTEEPGRL